MRNASKTGLWEWASRFCLWYGVWLVFSGWSMLDAMVGIPAAVLAAWAGTVLRPRDGRRVWFLRVVRYAVRFVWQSVAAGVDVAWRVFQPTMPLHPGLVRVAPGSLTDHERLLFRGIASLQPGSLACGVDEEGFLIFHCLDTREDAAAALLRERDEWVGLWKEESA